MTYTISQSLDASSVAAARSAKRHRLHASVNGSDIAKALLAINRGRAIGWATSALANGRATTKA
ncbi:hypothetical protein H5410_014716 [Solanum commersonii]|uniref:Uncharacterized protein n=1 Tax=Solanum commersonii TaxID=4109 RepID=A0A9J5ZS84_SOLCO|nr:hypothetical protein H5410_014716 [Solanum commersonii]